MRQHGWELPYHPLQVVAIAVFVSLAFAFYVFFIPFLGSKVLEYHVIAIFSPLVILVFALYIRCAAANPADPGIEIYNKSCGKSKASTKSSNSNKNGVIEEKPTIFKKALSLLFPCCAARSSSGRSRNQEDLLYCSLCEAEIFKYSKHCRACDKCVDGFDHHCRWINNCIGKKNYRTFVSLMVAGLLLLVIEWSAGVFVIVRCLLNRKDFQDDIVSKLGSSFSLVPFIVVVGLCTVLALLATLPLGQLFFFHLILIHKGISTYDYIVAMRERDQAQGDINSLQSSPVSSVATAVSNVSSLGALQRRPWCTPPRFLVEQQDTLVKDPLGGDIEHNGKEIVPLSTKKDDLAKNAKPKKQVKISPWKLARLNPEEVSKAAERARIKSSVLKPVTVINDTSVITETDSSNDSFGRSPGPEIVPLPASRKTKRKRDMSPAVKQKKAPSSKHSGSSVGKHSGSSVGKHSGCSVPDIGNEDSVAPLQMEARSAFWPASSSADNYNGNAYNGMSPLPRPWLQRSVSDGYEASGGESGEDSEHGRRLAHAWNRIRQSTTFMNRGALRPPPWVNATSQVRFANGEVGILKNTGMGWENPVPAVNSRRGNSTEESNSEASQYNSPDRDSDFFSAGDTSRPDLQKVHVQDS